MLGPSFASCVCVCVRGRETGGWCAFPVYQRHRGFTFSAYPALLSHLHEHRSASQMRFNTRHTHASVLFFQQTWVGNPRGLNGFRALTCVTMRLAGLSCGYVYPNPWSPGRVVGSSCFVQIFVRCLSSSLIVSKMRPRVMLFSLPDASKTCQSRLGLTLVDTHV